MTLQAQKSERNHKQIGKISKKSKNMKETTISYKEKMNNRKEESNLDCASKNVQQQRDQKCTCILGMGIKWKNI